MAEVIRSFPQVKSGLRLTYIHDRRNQLIVTDPKENSRYSFRANYVFFGEYKYLNTPVIASGLFDYGVWEITGGNKQKEFTDEEYESLLV